MSIGHSSQATQDQTTAVGTSADAIQTDGTAFGFNAISASNAGGTAIGSQPQARGLNSVAVGINATVPAMVCTKTYSNSC